MTEADSLRNAARLAEHCVLSDTGKLTPAQAARVMKDIIVACLRANADAVAGMEARQAERARLHDMAERMKPASPIFPEQGHD